MSPATLAVPARVYRTADLVPVSPAKVVEGDLVAMHDNGDGTWTVRPVIARRDGEHDPKWRCRKHEILVDAGPDEDGFFGQPDVLPMLIVSRELR